MLAMLYDNALDLEPVSAILQAAENDINILKEK